MAVDVVQLIIDGKLIQAESVLKAELKKAPDDHWLITHLALVKFSRAAVDNEPRLRTQAIKLFKKSLAICRCPLTTWYFAYLYSSGTRRQIKRAVQLLKSLVRAKANPNKDPCWESSDTAHALKQDCRKMLYSLLRKLGYTKAATRYYREYLRHYRS